MKTLYLSIIAISFVLVSISSQTAFAPMLYNNNDILEKFNANSTRMTKLVHDGAILITTQTIKKLEYKTGERITVNSGLTNIGNKSMTICYLWSPFFVVVNYQNGTAAWAKGRLNHQWNTHATMIKH